jgi:hypothetical protein
LFIFYNKKKIFRRIVLADTSTNSLIFVSNQSSSPSIVYLGGNKGGDGILWPIAGLFTKYDTFQLENVIKSNCSVLLSSSSSSIYKDSNTDLATKSSLIIEVLSPEFLGRLWKFKLIFPVYSNSNTIMYLFFSVLIQL